MKIRHCGSRTPSPTRSYSGPTRMVGSLFDDKSLGHGAFDLQSWEWRPSRMTSERLTMAYSTPSSPDSTSSCMPFTYRGTFRPSAALALARNSLLTRLGGSDQEDRFFLVLGALAPSCSALTSSSPTHGGISRPCIRDCSTNATSKS